MLTIELRNVVREYRVGDQTVRALDEINLRLTGGQFVSVIGPSGAGKSTFLHLLGAMDSPDSGSITFDGEEISRLSDEHQSEFRHHRVGFIFQFFNLLPTLSAWENVAVPNSSTASDSARSSPMRFGSSTGSGSAIGPSTVRRNSPVARCSAWPSLGH
jgi:putative ABC transport system ATP-binding protein